MPDVKCMRCGRWSHAEGCQLERKNYFHFRECMTGKKSHWFSADRLPSQNSVMRYRMPAPDEADCGGRREP